MFKRIFVSVFYLLLHIPAYAQIRPLPDDKVDTAPEVDAINHNFNLLNRGKLDLKPGHIIPRADSTYNIGASGMEWANVYADSMTVTSAIAVGPSGFSSVAQFSREDPGATVTLILRNNSATASSHARLLTFVNGAGAGNPFVNVSNNVNEWLFGMDNADSDKWKLSYNAAFGAGGDRLVVDSAGHTFLSGSVTATSATINGAITATTMNTGFGHNELYQMDQAVMTTSTPTFATVDTGQGLNELYDMDQNVLTTSTPTFSAVTHTGIANAANQTGRNNVIEAWAVIDGTATLIAGYNVTSITDVGTGDFQLNFTNALDNANYAISGSVTEMNAGVGFIVPVVGAIGTTSCRIRTVTHAGTLSDPIGNLYVVIIR